MQGPLFENYWSQPSRRRYPPAASGYPVYPVQREQPVTVAPNLSPKIVRIPVHFVGSESTRSAAALKIQKVFRGFLVRRSMNRVMSVAREVDEIERRISQSETVELLRREKERIRMNEALMSLLFKLDSVRGIDSGVRDCRKAVTRKAIALQDKIDAIVNTDHQSAEVCDKDLSENALDQSDNSAQINVENKDDCVEESESNCWGIVENPDTGVDECNEKDAQLMEEKNESLKSEMEETRNRDNENRKNTKLLEKMIEENGKMMKLMTQLSERNEAQTKMLNALTQRVGQLEKAFICDKLRRKKMKKHNTSP